MKKRILSFSLILIVIFWTIYNSISLATTNTDDNSFISVDKTELSPGDDLLIYINMDQINYENFKVVVNSSVNMDDIAMTDNSVDGAEVNVDNNNTEMTLTGNKTTMNVNKVTLNYVILDNIEVGSTIVISAELTNTDDQTVEATTKDITINIVNKSTNTTDNTTENNTTNTIGNNTLDNNQTGVPGDNTKIDSIGTGSTQQIGAIQTSEMKLTGTESNGSQSSYSGSSSYSSKSSSIIGTGSTEEQIVYNGSSDNYLSALSIDGYSLNKDFSKENTTYFVKASKNTTSLDVNATADDSSATVNIYGQSELKEGTNKILISVTAEDGSVRTYRIYVTIES